MVIQGVPLASPAAKGGILFQICSGLFNRKTGPILLPIYSQAGLSCLALQLKPGHCQARQGGYFQAAGRLLPCLIQRPAPNILLFRMYARCTDQSIDLHAAYFSHSPPPSFPNAGMCGPGLSCAGCLCFYSTPIKAMKLPQH